MIYMMDLPRSTRNIYQHGSRYRTKNFIHILQNKSKSISIDDIISIEEVFEWIHKNN